MAFIITGDTHATLDIDKVVRFFAEHEDEYDENLITSSSSGFPS